MSQNKISRKKKRYEKIEFLGEGQVSSINQRLFLLLIDVNNYFPIIKVCNCLQSSRPKYRSNRCCEKGLNICIC